MKQVIIKTDEFSVFLRTEAVSIAIEYEETLMASKRMGSKNGAIWLKQGTSYNYEFYVYHNKTSIFVNVQRILK